MNIAGSILRKILLYIFNCRKSKSSMTQNVKYCEMWNSEHPHCRTFKTAGSPTVACRKKRKYVKSENLNIIAKRMHERPLPLPWRSTFASAEHSIFPPIRVFCIAISFPNPQPLPTISGFEPCARNQHKSVAVQFLSARIWWPLTQQAMNPLIVLILLPVMEKSILEIMGWGKSKPNLWGPNWRINKFSFKNWELTLLCWMQTGTWGSDPWLRSPKVYMSCMSRDKTLGEIL